MNGLMLVFTLALGQEKRPPDRWFAVDKTKHFFASVFVQSAAFSALRSTGLSKRGSLTGATAATAAVGIAKEIMDARGGGTASAKDLTWDVLGMAAASALLQRTER